MLPSKPVRASWTASRNWVALPGGARSIAPVPKVKTLAVNFDFDVAVFAVPLLTSRVVAQGMVTKPDRRATSLVTANRPSVSI
jgi:hypothetical protein